MAEAFRFRHVPDAVLQAAGLDHHEPNAAALLALLDDRDRQLEDFLSSLGGGPRWARLEWVPGGAQAADTVIIAGNGNTWNVVTDEIGLTVNANGVLGTPAGLVVATGVVDFAHATTGSRWSELSAIWTFSRDEKMAVTVAGRGTFNNMTVVERVAAGANNFALSFAHYATGATLGVGAYLTMALWPPE